MNTERNEQEELLPDDALPVSDESLPETEESIVVVEHRRPRKVYSGMWGIPELIVTGASLLFLLAVIALYLFFVIPEQSRLDSNRVRKTELDGQLADAKRRFGDITTTEAQVARLIGSVEDFETRFLAEETRGRTAVYQRLNGLIDAFGLENTTGPDYAPLELTEEERVRGGSDANERGRSRFQSLFPGIYVTMTVEGRYANLRRFINELENSGEFMVISAIELEPAEADGSGSPGAGSDEAGSPVVRTGGRMRGVTVSLRLELAAYFQRNNEERMRTSFVMPEDEAAAPAN